MIPVAASLLALAAAVVMVDRPVTVVLDVPEKVRHAEVVSLRLEGVVMKRNAPAVWNIFWEMPLATSQTSVENKHFAGSITSPANSALRDPKPANFGVQLPPEAVSAMRRLSSIRFTFVPIRKLPEGGVAITALRLE